MISLHQLLEIGVNKQASDLHLVPNMPPLLRINGLLQSIEGMDALSPSDTQNLIYSAMSVEQQTYFEQHFVLEMALALQPIGFFRVSVLHQIHGIGAVFRIIPTHIPTFDELSLPSIFKSILNFSHGIVLVAGPTGSGKSTTLAAMIDHINCYQAKNIITIEDPIEFIHTPKKSIFHQIQVGRDTPDFSTALRASLRQDPDVILLGELRDLETMRLALTAAETGHLVLATVHSCSAPIAINRFADVFPTEEKNRVRMLLSETLQAVIFQTLVKKKSGGRIAAFEIMLATPAIRHFIRQDMPAHMISAMQIGANLGMSTLENSLNKLVSNRIINRLAAENVLMNRGLFEESDYEKLKK